MTESTLRFSFVVLAVAACVLGQTAAAQTPAGPKPQLLWPDAAPGAQGTADEDKPTITPYLVPANKSVGTAVVVCPGGGYQHLSMDKEGSEVAHWLNSLGIQAFVLKYRLGPKYHHPIELGDAQRAIRTVRAMAVEYHIQPNRIGIMGFSAGGHLASTAGTHFDTGKATSADPIERAGSRPDFLVLCYPVISFTSHAHVGSMHSLLGDNPDPQLVQSLSNESQVTVNTPPTFLFHTTADQTVPVENSIMFYTALRQVGVPAEMHIYEQGPHGVGLATTDAALSSWPDRLANWLRIRGLLR